MFYTTAAAAKKVGVSAKMLIFVTVSDLQWVAVYLAFGPFSDRIIPDPESRKIRILHRQPVAPVWKRVLLSAWRTLKRTVFKVWFLQWLWRPNLTPHWRRPYYYHGIIWSEPWLLLEESDPPDFGSENPCAKMTGSNVPQTNGASLEDCHANFFALVRFN